MQTMSDSTANRIATATATAVSPATSMAAATNELVDEDAVLSKSELLGRDEVLKRRSRRLKQLARVYKDHYWNMMEEMKVEYRRYYWKYGKSPYQENESVTETDAIKNGEDDELGLELSSGWSRCAVHGCKFKAMALTKFCHGHILSDPKQKLYVKCDCVVKSSQAGPLICGKPVLRNTVPSLCVGHFQKAEKHVSRALKKAGLNVSTTNRVAPKFHILLAESVRQIQINRRIAEKEMKENLELKEEEISI